MPDLLSRAALADSLKALSLRPDEPSLHNDLGLVYRALKRFDEGKKELIKERGRHRKIEGERNVLFLMFVC